jgi:hypothetical protein
MHTHTHTHTQNLVLKNNFSEWVIHVGTAKAMCGIVDDVLHISYVGGINRQAFHGIDLSVRRLRMLAPVALERMDQAFTVVGPSQVSDCSWPSDTPPSAVIVRDDQYQFSASFGARLAERGILRLTFLQQDLARAQRFVQLFPATH